MSENEEIREQVWKETKKEYEVKADGNEILTKITRESTIKYGKLDKDRWVLVFQAIGSFGIVIAIIINLVVLNHQNNFQLKQQKSLFELGIYSKAINDISITISKPKNDSAYRNAENEIDEVIIPSVQLLQSDKVYSELVQYYELLNNEDYFNGISDSLFALKNINSAMYTMIEASYYNLPYKNMHEEYDIRDISVIKTRLHLLGMYWDKRLDVLRQNKKLDGIRNHVDLIEGMDKTDFSHSLDQNQIASLNKLLANKDSVSQYFDSSFRFFSELSFSLSTSWESIYEQIRSGYLYKSSISLYPAMQKMESGYNPDEFIEIIKHIDGSYLERKLFLKNKIIPSMVESNQLLN